MRKMKDSGIEWIGAIPDSWHLDRLQWHLDEIKESNKPVKTQQVLSLTNKLGVIPYEEKGEQGNKSKENIDEYKLAYPDTIVVNSMNILIGSVGKCNYFGCVSPVYYVFKPKNGENIDFLNYIFQLTQFQKELRKYANGILEIRLRVSSNDILKRQIAFPSGKEQQKIVSFLNEKMAKIDKLIEIENKQIEKLKEYKQAVITEAVTKGLDKSAPMKDSGVEWIGEIPEDWEVCRVKNIGFTQNGISKSGELFGNGYPFISYGDVYKHWVLPQTGSGLIESTEKDRKIFSVNKGDIFFTRTSETIEEVGFSSVCFETITNATFAGFLIRLRPYQLDSIIKSNYAKYYFRANLLRKYLVREMNIVTRASLSQELLGAMSVVLPPTNTQIEISLHLDSQCKKIDSLISIKQKKIDMLNEYKKSLIYEYVTGKKEVV